MKYLVFLLILVGCENNSPTNVKFHEKMISACKADCAPHVGNYNPNNFFKSACQCEMKGDIQ